LALAAAALRLPLAAQEPRFSGQLTIREREILVDVPDLLEGDRLAAGDFQVRVDGQPREVSRAAPAAGAWTVVVYVDPALASPGTVFYSGLALANRAADLTRLGTVELVVADPEPRVTVPPTREPLPLHQALADLAAAARVERDRAGGLAAAGPSPDRIRGRLDELLLWLTARRPAGPHAVFLIMDGPDLTPEQTAALGSPAPAGGPETVAAVFQRTARLLAAYGWVAIPVPLRKEQVGAPIAPRSELDIFRETTAPSSQSTSLPPIRPSRRSQKTTLAFPGVLDLFLAPQTAALRLLSQATAGTLLGFEEQIGPTLAALVRRWRLWIPEPDAPADGRLHPLAVTVADQTQVGVVAFQLDVGLPGRRKDTRSPLWLRSGTPEEIAEMRLAALLAGQAGTGGELPLSAAARRTPAGLELQLAVAGLPAESAEGPLRISYAVPTEGGSIFHHAVVAAGDLGKGWRGTVAVAPPPGSRRLAVVVEALGAEKWAGRVLPVGD